MTDQLPSAGGLRSEQSSGNGCNEVDEPLDVANDAVVDRFSEIAIIEHDGGASDASSQSASIEATHIIVLIHGWMGNPAEMSYIRESIQRAAARASARCASESSTKVKHRHRFVLHSPSCNEDRTDDGIAMGGSRLAQEINDLVRHVVERENERVGGESNIRR